MDDQQRRPNPMRLATAGVEFIGIFGLMLTAGILLDRRFALGAVCTVWFGVIGFGYALYRLLKQANKVRKYEEFSKEYDRDDDLVD